MSCVPLTVTARNEERALGPCLDSLLEAVRVAEASLPVRLAPLVVLDDCTDGTGAVARSRGVATVASSGGKVEAQRRGNRPGPFQLFSDADVRVAPDTLRALCAAMLADERMEVAFPPKRPLPPRRRTPLAWALHRYNRARGYSSSRTWFSGKLFAIRRWSVPRAEELVARAAALPASAFYAYGAPLQVDDIYLSLAAVARRGPEALRETEEGLLEFRAPETWRGMYRYYRRMRRELERMDALFPELAAARARYGRRQADLLAGAGAADRTAYALFQAALWPCRGLYRLERAARERLRLPAPAGWPAIPETKVL